MSPGQEAIYEMLTAYKEELATEKNNYPSLNNSGGYRQAAIKSAIKYEHIKIINGIELIDSCSLPGWWATLFISKWQCPICNGKWELMNLFDYEFWEKSE